MKNLLSRFAVVLFATAMCPHPTPVAHADFTESEDRPFLDPDGSEDDPLAAPVPLPWDATSFTAAYPGGAKLVRGSLDQGDVDAYSIVLTSGELVLGALFEDGAGERNDTSLGIFTGAVAPPVAADDDGGSGFLSRLAFVATTSGVYRIAVTGFGDVAYDGSHLEALAGLVEYRLVVAVTADPPSLAEIENNDSIAAATPLPSDGGVVGGRLDPFDVDYYALALEAGDRVAVSLFDLQTGSFFSAGGERNDSILGVFDPAQALAAGGTDDDGGPGRMSNLLFTATTSGTWSIAVSGYGDDTLVGQHGEEAFDYLLVIARERACPNVVPLISNVTASTSGAYVVANLQGGDHYYTDRTNAGRHVIVDVPPAQRCAEWIKTANDDKNVGTANHLSFDLAAAASVYIGYDTRATAEPTWLSSAFTPQGEVIDVADPDPSQEFDLLRRDFAAGPVVLGGNAAPGAGSNYVVFARPLPTADPTQALTVPVGVPAVTLIVSGVEVQVFRAPGQTDEEVAQALADAVNNDPSLAAARIYGLASSKTFVTTGTIEDFSFAVPVPLFAPWGVGLLVSGLIATVAWAMRKRSRLG